FLTAYPGESTTPILKHSSLAFSTKSVSPKASVNAAKNSSTVAGSFPAVSRYHL
ncbi:hypothetical protein HK096_008136, partial [Nowakowskiella sp. JEL0078]